MQTVSFPGVTREISPGLPLPAGEDDDDGVWVGAQAARTIVDSAATATTYWRNLLNVVVIKTDSLGWVGFLAFWHGT